MANLMTVCAEAWVVAADEDRDGGIWLVNGSQGPWRTLPLETDQDMHEEVELAMWRRARITRNDLAGLHSTSGIAPYAEWSPGPEWTSWRPDGGSMVHTYMAPLVPGGFVLDRWPDAAPVTVPLARKVKPPAPHEASDAPLPRYIDVMFHGLGHLKYLIRHNREYQVKLGPVWKHHLEPFTETLAKMYDQRYVPAA